MSLDPHPPHPGRRDMIPRHGEHRQHEAWVGRRGLEYTEFHAALGGFGDLRGLRRDMSAWMNGHQVPLPVVDDLLLAITEVATNAIEASPTDRASVLGQTSPGRIELSVSNDGPEFSGEHRPAAGPELSERGRGLHITRSVVDSIRFGRLDDCTEVTLTKRY